MQTINIDEAKTQLLQLVDQAAEGESFIIAKAGKPKVKVTALDAPPRHKSRRIGFLKDQINIPDNFDTMFQEEIEERFYTL